jgi:hypothetical protein
MLLGLFTPRLEKYSILLQPADSTSPTQNFRQLLKFPWLTLSNFRITVRDFTKLVIDNCTFMEVAIYIPLNDRDYKYWK